MRDFIHYGFSIDDFDPLRIKKAKNSSHAKQIAKFSHIMPQDTFKYLSINKPEDGFWASRIDSVYGWKEWVIDNDYKRCDLSKSFKFSLEPDARVYIISSSKDVELLIERYHLQNTRILDFEEMQKEYDAIEVTTMNNGVYEALYGWDCESLLILNPCIIKYNRLLNLINQDIRICDEPFIEEEHINFVWEMWFDVDDYFGTDINDDEMSWINFYTNMYKDGSVEAFYVIDTPEKSETHFWPITKDEKEFLSRKMNAYINMDVDSYIRKYQ